LGTDAGPSYDFRMITPVIWKPVHFPSVSINSGTTLNRSPTKP
jgi:hypothetical protein